MACTPDDLADSIKCLSKWTEKDLLAAAVLLLCEINGGTGPPPLGAAPEIYTGVWDDPNGHVVPNRPTEPARYSQLESSGGDGTEWHWQADLTHWL